MFKGFRIILGIFLLSFAVASAETVTRVHDGDSFHVAEFKEEVRIFGIDAPEVAAPPGIRGHHPGQPYSKLSRNYLRTLILGKVVKLDCNHSASHKRPVCTVYQDGLDVGSLMIMSGLAYNEPHFTQMYIEDEAVAKSKGLCVWSLPNGGIRPWEWRKSLRKENRYR